jgi:RNA polymerase sigma-70 factor (ECF subfamily)
MGHENGLAELTAGLRGKEAKAWERLYALTHLPLLRYLRRILRDHAMAEEALQATYVTAIERIAAFDAARGSVDAWLAGIARNKAHETVREHTTILGGEPLELAAPEADGDSTDGHSADGELVALALDQLEPRYAEVLRRKYLAEESLETIALGLSLKQATVGTLLHRGRERFREVYQRLLRRTENGTWKRTS